MSIIKDILGEDYEEEEVDSSHSRTELHQTRPQCDIKPQSEVKPQCEAKLRCKVGSQYNSNLKLQGSGKLHEGAPIYTSRVNASLNVVQACKKLETACGVNGVGDAILRDNMEFYRQGWIPFGIVGEDQKKQMEQNDFIKCVFQKLPSGHTLAFIRSNDNLVCLSLLSPIQRFGTTYNCRFPRKRQYNSTYRGRVFQSGKRQFTAGSDSNSRRMVFCKLNCWRQC